MQNMINKYINRYIDKYVYIWSLDGYYDGINKENSRAYNKEKTYEETPHTVQLLWLYQAKSDNFR